MELAITQPNPAEAVRSFPPELACPNANTPGPIPRAELPPDVRQWVDPCTLTLWVEDEIDASQPAASKSRRESETERSSEMLPLLAFAYSSNVLQSDEITLACRTHPAFRFLCKGSPPFPHEITRFRRRHRAQLENLLTRVLARVLLSRTRVLNPALYPCLLRDAKDRLDSARHLDTLN
jgi:hypothetical protein